jgi:GT2 family glycosyltransferase
MTDPKLAKYNIINMKHPRISIIILNYNGKKWVKKCLDSLCNQTYTNFEIIFVDNASIDDSAKFVRENYPKVKIIINKINSGFAGGNNIGINYAKGKYILLINNDTVVENDFLEKIYKFYINNKYVVIAPYSKDYTNIKTFKPYYSTIDFLGHPVSVRDSKEAVGFYLSGVCLFFNKKIYKKTLGLDNNFFMYCEDVDWFWRLSLLEIPYGRINNLYIYHEGAGFLGKGIKYDVFLWRNQNTLQMLLKNYQWFNLVWILPIYFLQNVIEIVFFLMILKPKIAFSYIEGWIFNVKNIWRTLKERKWVQKNRKVSDIQIMKKMYPGIGRLIHLKRYIFKLCKLEKTWL